MDFIIKVCSCVACKFYQENINIYLKKSIIFLVVEICIAIWLRYINYVLFEVAYSFYVTIYSINIGYVGIKMADSITNKIQNIPIIRTKIAKIKLYIKIILLLSMYKASLETLYIGNHLTQYYSVVITIITVIVIGDMILKYYKEIIYIFNIFTESATKETCRWLDCYIIIYLLSLIYYYKLQYFI
jgi:hypothetical protein